MKSKTKYLIGCLLLTIAVLGYIVLYLPFAERFQFIQYTVKGNISGYEMIDSKLVVTVETDAQQYRCQIELETVYDMQCHILFDKRLTDVPIYVVLTNYPQSEANRNEDAIYSARNVGVLYDSAWDGLLRDGKITEEDIAKYTSKGGGRTYE